MKVVCISDTHLDHDFVIPSGDLLIHAGDLTSMGTFMEIKNAGEWLASQPHPHKIVIAGNHDFLFEKDQNLARLALGSGVTYLQDEGIGITISGITYSIWGSPWTPRFYDWAFQLGSQKPADKHWGKIPRDLDILVTHGPPFGILDKTPRGDHVGDKDLLYRVRQVKPTLHVFGHIHGSHGIVESSAGISVNAATCDEYYNSSQEPIVVEL